jgi:tetratricopeptide (TPR) repeat protein
VHWSYAGGRGYPQFLDYLLSGVAMLSPGCQVGQRGEEVLNRQFILHDKLPGVWNGCYNTITLCNLAIEEYENDPNHNPLNLDVSGTDYKDNYLRQIGEYHFLRGYTYWWLLKVFAPKYDQNGDNSALAVPLKTKAATSMAEIQEEKRGTVAEIYQQVIADLQYAKDNLPDKFNLNSWNNVPGYECGRANKWVATGMLGKVYWLLGQYDKAQALFEELINYAETTGTYQLEEPRDPFIQARAFNVPKESIWEFNSGEVDIDGHRDYVYPGRNMGFRNRDSQGHDLITSPEVGVGTTLGGYGGGVAVTIGYTTLKRVGWMEDPLNGDYTVTQEAEADLRWQQVYHKMNPYEPGIVKGDPRYITTESFEGHSQITTPVVYIDKFFRGEHPYGRYSKFPLLRLADFYLLVSWLRWQNGDLQGAADYMNIVWNRSNPTNPDIYNAGNVDHNAIFTEYLREMTGEGWTCDFMMATQMTIPKGDANLLQDIEDPNTEVPPPYEGWYWPIPTDEQSLNPDYN